jgi:hypothetical protein
MNISFKRCLDHDCPLVGIQIILAVQGKKVPRVKKDGEIIPRAGILWLTGS